MRVRVRVRVRVRARAMARVRARARARARAKARVRVRVIGAFIADAVGAASVRRHLMTLAWLGCKTRLSLVAMVALVMAG